MTRNITIWFVAVVILAGMFMVQRSCTSAPTRYESFVHHDTVWVADTVYVTVTVPGITNARLHLNRTVTSRDEDSDIDSSHYRDVLREYDATVAKFDTLGLAVRYAVDTVIGMDTVCVDVDVVRRAAVVSLLLAPRDVAAVVHVPRVTTTITNTKARLYDVAFSVGCGYGLALDGTPRLNILEIHVGRPLFGIDL